MVTVFFLGSGQRQSIGLRLAPALGKVMEIACHSRRQYTQQGEQPQLFLAEGAQGHICCPKGLIVLEGAPLEHIALEGEFIGILPCYSRPALEFAQKNNIKAVTCGLSPYDTLTLSSITGERAVVTLQREIRTLGGIMVEPADFPITLCRPWKAEAILTVAAILLLGDFGGQLSQLAL